MEQGGIDLMPAEQVLGHLLDPGCAVCLVHWSANLTRNWGIAERHAGEHVLWCIEEGAISGYIGERLVTLIPGDACWIQPWVRHRFRAVGAHRKVSMRFTLRRAGRDLSSAGGWLTASRAAPLGEIMRLAAPARLVPGQGQGGLRLRAILAAALGEFLDRAARGTPTRGVDLDALAAWWREQPWDAHPGVAELAARSGLTAAYFARAFRASAGLSPRAWLLRQRLERAVHLLQHEGRPVGEVARLLGYADHRLLDRQLRRHVGSTPGMVRRDGLPYTFHVASRR